MFNNNSKRYLITKMRLKGKKIWNVNKKSIEKFKKKTTLKIRNILKYFQKNL